MIDGQASVCHRLGVDLSGCRWPVRHVGFHSQHRRETHLSPNFAPSSPSPFPCCKIGHLLTKSKQTCSFRSPCTPDVTSPAVCQFTLSSCHAESVTYSNNSGQQHRTHEFRPTRHTHLPSRRIHVHTASARYCSPWIRLSIYTRDHTVAPPPPPPPQSERETATLPSLPCHPLAFPRSCGN
jgi:hypothetical protein